MSLSDARRAIDALTRIERLNYLDDLWTLGVASEERSNRTELAQIGREMAELLRLLRQDASWGLRALSDHREEFNRRANELLKSSSLSESVKEELHERFARRGWATEATNAFEHLLNSAEIEHELEGQIADMERDLLVEGDLPNWFKCISLAGGSAMGILALVLAPPAVPAAFALQLTSGFLLAVPALEICGGPHEPPAISDDAARVLEALIGETRAVGAGVAIYPFESVAQGLGLPPAAVSRAIVELQTKDLIKFGNDVTLDRYGRRTTFPVYRVTKKGFRMPPLP